MGNSGQSQAANLTHMGDLEFQGQTGIGNAQASAHLANQGMGMGLLGGITKGLTSAIPGLGAAAGGSSILGSLLTGSDERLKENIEPVGELYDGQQIYRYNYIDDIKPHIGLMAQEVQESNPHAVGDIGGGYLGVNYALATDRAAELARFLDAA